MVNPINNKCVRWNIGRLKKSNFHLEFGLLLYIRSLFVEANSKKKSEITRSFIFVNNWNFWSSVFTLYTFYFGSLVYLKESQYTTLIDRFHLKKKHITTHLILTTFQIAGFFLGSMREKKIAPEKRLIGMNKRREMPFIPKSKSYFGQGSLNWISPETILSR